MIRRFFPIAIVLAAIGVYESRATWLPVLGPRRTAPVDSVATTDVPPAGPRAVDADAVAPSTAVRPNTRVVRGAISRGTPFFVEMKRAGVSPMDIDRIVRASRRVYDFRRVRPGQTFAVYEGAGGLDSLRFVINSGTVLNVTRSGGRFHARRDTIPYEVDHYVTSGTIEQSIFATLQRNGADPELASYLAVIFQWDIDFFKDIRRGDTFAILYEKKVFPGGRVELGNVLAAKIYTRGRVHYAFSYRTRNGRRSYYDAHGKSLQKSLLRAPLRYSRISSSFTRRRLHPITHTYKPHLGVDYVAPRGTPIHSTGDGVVVTAGWQRANGNYVKIRHNNRYATYYLHLKGLAKGIKHGRRVRQGQVIGYLGSTGMATAPHLDYRIKVNGRFVNPRTVRLPSKRPVPSGERALFAVVRDGRLMCLEDGSRQGDTVLVARPTPPLQTRMAGVFLD